MDLRKIETLLLNAQGMIIELEEKEDKEAKEKAKKFFKSAPRGRTEEQIYRNTLDSIASEKGTAFAVHGERLTNWKKYPDIKFPLAEEELLAEVKNQHPRNNPTKEGEKAKTFMFNCDRIFSLLEKMVPGYPNLNHFYDLIRSDDKETPDLLIVTDVVRLEDLKYRILFRFIFNARTFFRFNYPSEKGRSSHFYKDMGMGARAGIDFIRFDTTNWKTL